MSTTAELCQAKEQASTHETGGPELQDGLSPMVLPYSRMTISPNWIVRCSAPFLLASDPYVLCRLSSNVRHFIIDFTSNIVCGKDRHRRTLSCPRGAASSSLIVSTIERVCGPRQLFLFLIPNPIVLGCNYKKLRGLNQMRLDCYGTQRSAGYRSV